MTTNKKEVNDISRIFKLINKCQTEHGMVHNENMANIQNTTKKNLKHVENKYSSNLSIMLIAKVGNGKSSSKLSELLQHRRKRSKYPFGIKFEVL